MRMPIEFRDHHTLGHPFQLQVLKSGRVIGHVRRNVAGLYQYLRGEFNVLVFEFQSQDLDELKQKIEQTEGDRS
jgi:hypothetical protein